MSGRKRLLWLLGPLLASVSAFAAHAGVTISDRRCWPNEARVNPGPPIETLAPSYAPPGVGSAIEPRPVPRRKVRRVR